MHVHASLQSELRLGDEQVVKLGELTEGFSFAYLKELFLSSMMRWIANPQQGNMDQVMANQVSVLRDQMVSAEVQSAIEPGPEAQQQELLQQMGRMLPRRVIYRNP